MPALPQVYGEDGIVTLKHEIVIPAGRGGDR
jgi:hypothetical protein